MTITISAQTHQELFAEVNETPQNNDPDDELDVTWKSPQALGEGHYRRVELRQNLVLEIESYQRHENLIIQGIDRPHPLEFWLMLSGQWWENSPWGVNETAAGQYGFCGNGLREFADFESTDLANIERVEVLSGPASVLYGQAGPGGIVNLVTKQPLRDPFYAVDATIGSFDFYRGAIDLSGPLNDSKTVLYRLNVSYLNRNAFVENFEETEFFISPVISLALGKRTRLTLEGEYTDKSNGFVIGLPAEGTVLPNPNGRMPRFIISEISSALL